MNEHIKIRYSAGRSKYGRAYVYIRPAGNCLNRSRRVAVEKLESEIKKHFPVVNYYLVNGCRIGAKDEMAAICEYWRICEESKIGEVPDLEIIENE